MTDFDQVLDACGINCPLPILRTKQKLMEMKSGQVLRITTTDPGSVQDFDAFATQTGHVLQSSTEEDGKYIFLLKIT